MCQMNNFFCGLHFMVGLTNQAAKVVKIFEKVESGGES